MDYPNEKNLAVEVPRDNGNSPAPSSLLKPEGPPSNALTIDAEKASDPIESEKPPREVSGIAWFLVVISILVSTFLFALDNTIVADIQPAIVERFGAITKLPWLSASFFLAAAGTNLFWYGPEDDTGQSRCSWLTIVLGGKCMGSSMQNCSI